MPKISVIIPVYNGEKTIRTTIESVLEQTFKDFEILVVNDGSTDSTLTIVSEIIDSRIQVFSYPHSGAPKSRNRGFEQSSGEYIAFLDADDIWATNKLELQLQALENNPDAAVAYSWTDYLDESGKFLQKGTHQTFNGDVYPQLLVNNFLENGSNPLIRREALADIGGFDETLLAGQDLDLYIRLATRYRFVAIPKVLVFYRISTNSMSADVIRQEQQCLAVIEKAFSQAPESLQHLKKQSLAKLYKYLFCRAVQGYPSSEKGWAAIRFLMNYIKYDSSALKQWRILLIILFKGLIIALLPPLVAHRVLSRLKKSR